MASDGPPIAYAALILLLPWPGMSTTVSRGIESVAFAPPPTRISMIESDRDGEPMTFAPASLVPLVRASEPSTRIVFALVSVKPAPDSWRSAASEIFDSWIWAETRKTTAETRIQVSAASATYLRTRPTVMRRRTPCPPTPRLVGSSLRGSNRRRRPWTSYSGRAPSPSPSRGSRSPSLPWRNRGRARYVVYGRSSSSSAMGEERVMWPAWPRDASSASISAAPSCSPGLWTRISRSITVPTALRWAWTRWSWSRWSRTRSRACARRSAATCRRSGSASRARSIPGRGWPSRRSTCRCTTSTSPT